MFLESNSSDCSDNLSVHGFFLLFDVFDLRKKLKYMNALKGRNSALFNCRLGKHAWDLQNDMRLFKNGDINT